MQLRSLSCGPATFAVAADRSVITWGAASNGELGYGKHGKKSSARPGKVRWCVLWHIPGPGGAGGRGSCGVVWGRLMWLGIQQAWQAVVSRAGHLAAR